MIEKIKSYLKRLEINQQKIMFDLDVTNKLSKEVEWANIYHDSIRGKKWLEELPLNVGRWAGNYSFFYILNRILNDYCPKTILEHGLGESTKVISTYIDNQLLNTKHIVVEQNLEWVHSFNSRFNLSERTEIIICQLTNKEIKGYNINCYENYEKKINSKFDLYVIDGPYGSDRYSRYDIVSLVEKFESDDQFIIIFDDANRQGEMDTYKDILSIIASKNIKYYTEIYSGNKSTMVIATEKYKFATSL